MEIRKLHFAYDQTQVLTDINLSFPQGKFISILGPNGSGKSTLLKLILGLIKPNGGDITLDGKPMKAMKALEKAQLLSYVPQSFQNSYEFTVEEVVSMGRYPFIKQFGNATKEDQAICEEAMAITETLRLKDQPVSRISGGELQRVSVARAIAQTTPWILLDEPVNHLDVSHQVGILQALKAMTPERTIITVMHDLNLARDFSDHVIMLHEGKVVKTGKPGECIDPVVLATIYDLEFIKAHTADGSLQYLFPKTKP